MFQQRGDWKQTALLLSPKRRLEGNSHSISVQSSELPFLLIGLHNINQRTIYFSSQKGFKRIFSHASLPISPSLDHEN